MGSLTGMLAAGHAADEFGLFCSGVIHSRTANAFPWAGELSPLCSHHATLLR